MELKNFDFEITEDKIAQSPYFKRDEAKLLVINRKNNEFIDKKFSDIIDYFDKNDVLVLNNTKVIPARLIGHKEKTNAKIEILLLEDIGNNCWKTLTKPLKRLKIGDFVIVSKDLKLELIDKIEDGVSVYKLHYEGILLEILDKIGKMPLPPYITKQIDDNSNYQTVYAKIQGSAAAPTAGFHFTTELLERLKNKGVEIINVTLNIGLGTFRPVAEENILNHKMHEETYEISEEAAERLNNAIKNNKKIVACGTTSLRTLEANYDNGFHHGKFRTDIFIYPGYKFKVVDKLITNFHLPKSSLIMLVSAFYNLEEIKKCYKHALDNGYLFFSFGDAMFLM